MFNNLIKIRKILFSAISQLFRVIPQFMNLREVKNKRFDLKFRDLYLCLNDRTGTTSFDRHYVYHTAWATRAILNKKPAIHVDISSSLYFVANVSAFMPVQFYDYRPANLVLNNLTTGAVDLFGLPIPDSSVASLSCMHVVEHIGLGRYGDPVDYDGDLKAVSELQRVLAPEGQLLFVVPIGGQSIIQFNAHRIYTRDQILEMFSQLVLEEFTLIPESELDGGLIASPNASLLNKQRYGCGCFRFTKK